MSQCCSYSRSQSLPLLYFLILVRKKIVYLKLISDNVNDIANGKLGLTIGIKGKDELTQLAKISTICLRNWKIHLNKKDD